MRVEAGTQLSPLARPGSIGERRGTLRRDPHLRPPSLSQAYEASSIGAAQPCWQFGLLSAPLLGAWGCVRSAASRAKPLPCMAIDIMAGWRQRQPGDALAFGAAPHKWRPTLHGPTARLLQVPSCAVATGGYAERAPSLAGAP